jgi:geranylgeranyl reductase
MHTNMISQDKVAQDSFRDVIYDAVVIGGGPSGATAADQLARAGFSVLLADREGRIKPCGGAVPPRLIRDYGIPDELIVAKVKGAQIIAPSNRRVDMPIENDGYVGMVDREDFDPWLRARAALSGADRITGTFEQYERDGSLAVLSFATGAHGIVKIRSRFVIGADGANSTVARLAVPRAGKPKYVFAYHEIVEAPANGVHYNRERCDVYYQGRFSPDFYAWIFPHGDKASIGTGTAHKGFSLRSAIGDLRDALGLTECRTIRREGAPIPLKPLKTWDNGRDVVLCGDAAGVVAPASGEGIYYAMLCGEIVARAVGEALRTGDAQALASARKSFMKLHGRVFMALGFLQAFWYRNDWLREKFVAMCGDKDVQALTWQAYMDKELVRRQKLAHVRVMLKDIGALLGITPKLEKRPH